jgi:catechol 2,3-dioxygenase-like lactoylglutathione lyase family enzyme
MRIHLSSVLVDDQDKALRFYTEVLGFEKKTEIPLGEHRWLTVVSPEDPTGTELVLEPDAHPAAKPFKEALVTDGIPFTSFAVNDITAEFERLRELGVTFTARARRAAGPLPAENCAGAAVAGLVLRSAGGDALGRHPPWR